MPGPANHVKIFIVGSALLLCSCYTPAQDYKFPNEVEINKPQEIVWKKTVEYFANNNIPIKTIDKNSGIISGEKPADSKLVDCGLANNTPVLDKEEAEKPTIEFNILLKAEGNKTRVTIHDTIGQSKAFKPMEGDVPIECKSKGVFEADVLNYIKNN